MNRRIFFVSTGAAGLVAATGVTAFALTRTPARALLPWTEAGASRSDPRRFVVEHAVLAPNPHNRQPWIVELTGPGTMTLFCDEARRLPHTDPFDRQIVIGLGCFVELASIAATAIGYRLEVVPFPDGEPQPRLDRRPVAYLRLVRAAEAGVDPLFAMLKDRRSTKQPFDTARPVPPAAVARLATAGGPLAAVSTVTDAAVVAAVRDLTWQAWGVEARTKRTHMESVELMRIGRCEIEANPDGISLGGPLLEGLSLVGQMSREQLADTGSAAFRQGEAMYRAMLAATPAYLTVVSPDRGRAAELAAGRAYVRANLEATRLGLSMHPVSQALQEFPEMAEARKQMEDRLGAPPAGRLHMLARLGYGPKSGPSPRWAAATRIRTA